MRILFPSVLLAISLSLLHTGCSKGPAPSGDQPSAKSEYTTDVVVNVPGMT
ncbi:MAG: hypothetical protein HYX68_19700 [Planctomycetes bacterium]|jgi:hypothetical protein|nr:hypothetical protein [Planctomycetota bacterium]